MDGSGDERDTPDRRLLFGITPDRERAPGAADDAAEDAPAGADPRTGPAEPAPLPPEPEPGPGDREPPGDPEPAGDLIFRPQTFTPDPFAHDPFPADPGPAGGDRPADPSLRELALAVQRLEARLPDAAALDSTADLVREATQWTNDIRSALNESMAAIGRQLDANREAGGSLDAVLADLRTRNLELEQRITRLGRAFQVVDGAASAMTDRVAELHGVREALLQSHEDWIGESRNHANQILAVKLQLDMATDLVARFENAGTKLSERIKTDLQSGVAAQHQIQQAYSTDLRRTRLWIVPALAAALIAALLLAGFLAVSPHGRSTLIGHGAAGGATPAVWTSGSYQPPHCLPATRELQDPAAGAAKGCSGEPGAPRRA